MHEQKDEKRCLKLEEEALLSREENNGLNHHIDTYLNLSTSVLLLNPSDYILNLILRLK